MRVLCTCYAHAHAHAMHMHMQHAHAMHMHMHMHVHVHMCVYSLTRRHPHARGNQARVELAPRDPVRLRPRAR